MGLWRPYYHKTVPTNHFIANSEARNNQLIHSKYFAAAMLAEKDFTRLGGSLYHHMFALTISCIKGFSPHALNIIIIIKANNSEGE